LKNEQKMLEEHASKGAGGRKLKRAFKKNNPRCRKKINEE
jgi:hypothetical protein